MSRDKEAAQRLAQMVEDFRPGVYEHYKGRQYLALGLARQDETDEVVVVYTRLYPRGGLPMSTRRLDVWNEDVEHEGRLVRRFLYCGHVEPEPGHDDDDPDAAARPRSLVRWIKDNF
jgi:hypothetical protein